jgi:hypothetical protein
MNQKRNGATAPDGVIPNRSGQKPGKHIRLSAIAGAAVSSWVQEPGLNAAVNVTFCKKTTT